MHTSLIWLAMLNPAAPTDGPTWLHDYGQARREASAQKKPLAVFLSPGKGNWGKVVQSQAIPAALKRVLADRYLCVQLDTTSEAGRQLARDFEMSGDTGLILSDRSGAFQAFRHEGTLPASDLQTYLERHSSSESVVTTETHNSVRTSFYPSSDSTAPVAAPSTGGVVTPAAFQGWSQPSYGTSRSVSRSASC